MKIHIINGPNLNLLGKREPHLYGTQSFDSFFDELVKRYFEISLSYYQSNHEGALIDELQRMGFGSVDGILLNPGGYTHTSVALADTVSALWTPVVEVHLTDLEKKGIVSQDLLYKGSVSSTLYG